MTGQTTQIRFHIRRFNPETDTSPSWQEFLLAVEPGMTVLDGLHQLKHTQDMTLVWRYSCRMGVCGSCGMLINGRPGLACNTQILHVTQTAMTLAPLPNFPIVRDLVPDLTEQFMKHRDLKPYIIRPDTAEMENPTGEYYQTPDDLLDYLQFTYCIKCGCCMAACPTLATDPEYAGPQPLAQAYRYSRDSRDMGCTDRKPALIADHGIFSCHYGSECSSVCPKGVDPARAIQLMKRQLVLDYFKLLKKKPHCKILGPCENAERKPNIPAAPPYSV